MMRAMLGYAALILVLAAPALQAEVNASRRHVIILWEGTDLVYGQYLFTATNDESDVVTAELPVMLAKEKQDWFPQEGVLPKDVRLGEGGATEIFINQEFKPGDTFIVFNFSIPATYGQADLTLQVPYPIENLVIMTPSTADALSLNSEGMTSKQGQGFAGKPYDMLEAGDLQKGDTVRVRISGVNEGRSRYWWMGGSFAAVLLLLGAGCAWRTRPQEVEGDLVVEGSVG